MRAYLTVAILSVLCLTTLAPTAAAFVQVSVCITSDGGTTCDVGTGIQGTLPGADIVAGTCGGAAPYGSVGTGPALLLVDGCGAPGSNVCTSNGVTGLVCV